jgi:hypothetical protein
MEVQREQDHIVLNRYLGLSRRLKLKVPVPERDMLNTIWDEEEREIDLPIKDGPHTLQTFSDFG